MALLSFRQSRLCFDRVERYQPYLADLVWPLVTEFLRCELVGPALR